MSETPARSDVGLTVPEWHRLAIAVTNPDDDCAHNLEPLMSAVEAIIAERLAQAWSEGHTAGRDYQGDGWNSDAHDPERDNPYREQS